MESSILKFVKDVCYESHDSGIPLNLKKSTLVFFCLKDVEGRYFRFINLKFVAMYLYSFPSVNMKHNTFVKADLMKALIYAWRDKLDTVVPLSLSVEFSRKNRKQYMSQYFENS